MPPPRAAENPDDAERDALLKSKIWRDYQEAFSKASGLPLALRQADGGDLPQSDVDQSRFCALMAQTHPACSECLALQQQLAREARLEPKTLRCFAGLCESAVPVRVGDRLIAFLHTGHVLLEQPTPARFSRIANTLLDFGANVDLKQFEEAYFHTRVLSPQQYEAFVKLLGVFAQHLADASNKILLGSQPAESKTVSQARLFIADHQNEELTLRRVADAINLSAGYFSELFKKETGVRFVEYLARVRVEQARCLLQNSDLRVTEIAFRCGFGSLSQFNRTFRRIAGQTPQELRTELKEN
jgi:AraC-like DNA-binding protein/ligand-binding sensor protein